MLRWPRWTALGIAVAWLTAAGMANLLLPGTVLLWAVFAGSGVWALVPHKGQRPAYRRLVTPGAVLFWGMALAFAGVLFHPASRWQPSMMNSACGLPP